MDNEFKPVPYYHLATVNTNTTTATEHVAEIEQRIWIIKECCCGILCTLSYTIIPHRMLIHLLHFIFMWINNFPSSTGVSSTYSPWEIIPHIYLDYNKHCLTPFGAYCKTHNENDPTNSMPWPHWKSEYNSDLLTNLKQLTSGLTKG